MTTHGPRSWWQRFHALPRTSITKTLTLAFSVAFISALIVTGTRVLLAPKEQAHIDAARAESLLASLRSIPGFAEVLKDADTSALHLRLVDLQSGEFVGGDAEGFDGVAAAEDPAASVEIEKDEDVAGLGRRAKLAAVYLFGDLDAPELVVLPVHGAGYQSMIRAFVVLKGDLNTLAALTIYEHQETPGMGARIGDPEWQAQFHGKQAFTEDGRYALRLTPRGGQAGVHEVDGIAGATRSSNGVANMLKYWLGPDGYGPLLARLKNAQ